MNNFHPRKVVGRVSEKQLQVGWEFKLFNLVLLCIKRQEYARISTMFLYLKTTRKKMIKLRTLPMWPSCVPLSFKYKYNLRPYILNH